MGLGWVTHQPCIEDLARLDAYMYEDLKREELVRSGSVVLHELYFANLGGDPKPGGKILDLIKQWFGSYEQWEDEFKKQLTGSVVAQAG
jgi:superoxide dismutase